MEKNICRLLKKILIVIMTGLIMSGIFTVGRISAESDNKLKVGMYLEAGNGIRPGSGAGTSYLIDNAKDNIKYYRSQYIDTGFKVQTYSVPDDPETLDLIYINKQRYYQSKGSHTGGEYFILDDPDAYYKNGKYIFYLHTRKRSDNPLQISVPAQDKGPAWGLKVVSGDGSQSDPFRFDVVYSKPYDIDYTIHKESGSVDTAYKRAEIGENVRFALNPAAGNEIESVSAYIDTEIPLTNDGNEYSFVMPEQPLNPYDKVDVHIWFKESENVAEVSKDGGASWNSFNFMEAAVVAWNLYAKENDEVILRLNKDVQIDTSVIASEKNLVFDLNGHSIIQTAGNAVINSYAGSELIIKDSSEEKTGRITHQKNVSGRGIEVNGKVTMESGNIDGNISDLSGAGVYVADGGEFNMYGGKISGNKSSADGAGVYVENGAVFGISGEIKIEGNGKYINATDTKENNVYLNDKLMVKGELSSSSRLGIVTGHENAFSSGLKGKGTFDNFISNVDGKGVILTAENEVRLGNIEYYPLWVNGVHVNNGNNLSIPIEDGEALYDPESNTLSLKDAKIAFGIVDTGTSTYEAGILYQGDKVLNIEVSGSNTISSEGSDPAASRYATSGIRSNSDIVIGGNGEDASLAISLDNDSQSISYGNAINAWRYKVSLKDVKVNADTKAGYLPYSLYICKLDLENADLTINNTTGEDNATGLYLYSDNSDEADLAFDENSSLEITSYAKAVDSNDSGKLQSLFKNLATEYGALVNSAASSQGAAAYKSGTFRLYRYLKIPGAFEVSFNSLGGSSIDKQSVAKGEKVIKPADPTREGYLFAGWYKESAYKNEWDFANDTVSKNLTLYAKWLDAYAISYDLDGGVVEGNNPVSYTSDSETFTLVNPTKDHYEFVGWTGTGLNEPSQIVTIEKGSNGDRSYKAIWAPVTYTIKWLDDEGNVLKTEELAYDSLPVYSGSTPVKKESAQYEYTFKGWDPKVVRVTADAFYKAVFTETLRKYKVRFVDEDGTTVLKEETSYDYGTAAEDIVRPADPSKSGDAQYTYTFADWEPELAEVTGDITYKARYDEEVNKYTITFKNGDTILQSSKVEYGQIPVYESETPQKPAEEGQAPYVFVGWDPTILKVTGDETYDAVFEQDDDGYTVCWLDNNFDPLPGEAYTSKTGKLSDLKKLTVPDPSKEADGRYTYTFLNWVTQIDTTKKTLTNIAIFSQDYRRYRIRWVNGDTLLKEEDVRVSVAPVYSGADPTKESDAGHDFIFKGWTPKVMPVSDEATYSADFESVIRKYDVTFYDEDGTTVLKEKTSYDYGTLAGDIARPADPAQKEDEGNIYTFAGWDPEIVDVTGDAEYKARYTAAAKEYTITFNDHDGTKLQESKFPYGSKPLYSGLSPTREGYKFVGWDPAISEVKEDKVYTAVYVKPDETFTVTFDSGKGMTLTQEVKGGSVVIRPENPEIPGYIFVGWYKEEALENEWNFEKDIVTGNLTLHGKWAEEEYQVVYEANGGSGRKDPETRKYTQSLTLSENTFTRTGYEFAGWYDMPEGGNKITEIPVNTEGDVTVYAHWKQISFKVSLDANGGEVDKDSIEVVYGQPYGDLPLPEKFGVRFDGWYLEDSYETKVDKDTIVDTGKDHTLYARYYYVVYFYGDDARLVAEVPIYEDEAPKAISAPEIVPSKDDYVFEYWSDSSGEPYDFTKPINGNLTLRAQFYTYRYVGPFNIWILKDKGDLKFVFKRFEFILREFESSKDLKQLFEDGGKQLYVDGVLLAGDDYAYANGSLEVFLHDSYLDTLSVGRHNLKVVFKDGSASTDFMVKERTKPTSRTYIVPKTGD